MQEKPKDGKPKLILRIEKDGEVIAEEVIAGGEKIAYILGEAGLSDKFVGFLLHNFSNT